MRRHGHADHPLTRFNDACLSGVGEDAEQAGPAAVVWLRNHGEDKAADIVEVVGVAAPLMTVRRFAELETLIATMAKRHARHGPPTLRYFALGMQGYAAQYQGRHDEAARQVSHDRHDYYAGHGEAPGVWHGAFAEHLGLSGHVAANDFRAVLEGVHPTSGERLKPRANRRVAAWDVTFSPPKSISALWALAPEDAREHVREAQAAVVEAAIGYLTAHACVARLGRDGVDRQDGAQLGFLRAEFTHRCSREGDPQLHSHSILINVLEAPDGRRAALDGGLLFQHAKAADGIYQAALRAELSRRLGVGWECRDEQWEIAGIPPGLCREWSKRRSITAALQARGLDPDNASGRAAQTAALATRQRKVQVGDGGSLHDRFAREAIAAGFAPRDVVEAVLPLRAQRHRQPRTQPVGRSRRLLDAMTGPDGMTKQASSFSRRDAVIDLTARAAVHGVSADNAAGRVEILVNRLLRDDRVVPVLAPAAHTTSEILRVRDATRPDRPHGRPV